ncbi:unnamed protein product [Urochloa decumbens]|uniref:Dirigent protein n=1 Tax=Urochloa decumbens TaxID=240449 RepID=A0ABC9FIX7_9POAL
MDPAKFKITPSVAPAEWIELVVERLYLYQTTSGPNANQAPIIENTGPMGKTIVNNWEVYDGPGSDAKIVARAQGLHIQAGNWLCAFSLVFVNQSFSGSTLQVMGITTEFEAEDEWAIVGGTGEFDMATGSVTKVLYEQRSDGNVLELSIHALCPRGIRYPVIRIGPWGGKGGSQDIEDASLIKYLDSVTITHSGSVVDSIQFAYVDINYQDQSAGPWGGSGGLQADTIHLGESELITQVSGTIGTYGGVTAVTSIKFVTSNFKTYGPWGLENGTPFTYTVQPCGGIVGFFARDGPYLTAIGVYVRQISCL